MANEVEDAGHLTKPVFKVADHQVAGHRFEDGRVGSLTDDSGRFYKPLQDGARGDKEVTFYDRIWSDPNVPPAVQKFFPKFYGTIEIETPNGGGEVRHAIMEDLTHGFQRPNIVDVKMGARTWYLEAGPKYVEKCKLKDKETTSEALGFRLSGMQVFEAKKGEVWKASRAWCKYMKPEDVPEALKRFVSSNPSAEKGYDGAFAKAVYGAALTELQQLKAWLEVQTTYHFFSASVLLIYEGEPTIPQAVSVRLVDFAHVLYDRDVIDENQLSGLNALMKMLTELINSDTKFVTKLNFVKVIGAAHFCTGPSGKYDGFGWSASSRLLDHGGSCNLRSMVDKTRAFGPVTGQLYAFGCSGAATEM